MHKLRSSWLIRATCKTPDEDINKRGAYLFPCCKRGDISQLLSSASHTLSSWRDHWNTPKQCFCRVFVFFLSLSLLPSTVCTWRRPLITYKTDWAGFIAPNKENTFLVMKMRRWLCQHLEKKITNTFMFVSGCEKAFFPKWRWMIMKSGKTYLNINYYNSTILTHVSVPSL